MNSIRKLLDSDFLAYIKFATSVTQNSFMNWTEAQIIDCWGRHELWGLFHQNELRSVICLQKSGQDFEILWIQTHEAWLKNGLAFQLLSEWLCFASQQDGSVYLEVHEKNQAALGLYQKLGFEKLGIRKKYYSDGANAISFQLDLAKLKSPS